MKTIRPLFPAKGMLAAILAASCPLVSAQTVDPSPGIAPDSTPSRMVIPPENPAPTKLTASIVPIGKNSTTSGELTFIMTGNAVSVLGRIVGMKPNKRHQAVMRVPAVPAALDPAGTAVKPPSEARPPTAESPPTSSPADATKQVPDAATPNSESIELDLGTLISDATGAANVNSTIQNRDLLPPPTGILGCTVIIKRAPPLDSVDERDPVASGVIAASAVAVVPVPPGP